MDLIKDPEVARRKARAIASDILVYNRDKLKAGVENDNLFDVMSELLEEGREYYNLMIDPALLSQSNFYNLAIVDILVKSGGGIKSKIW